MKKLGIAVAIVLLLVSGMWLVQFRDVTNEPSYQDKPLSKWLENSFKLQPPHDPPMPEGQVAVRSIGTNALPHLLRMFTTKDSRLRSLLLRFDLTHGVNLRFLRLHSAEAARERAAAAFMTLADIAEPASLDIAKLAQDWNWTEVSGLARIILPYLGTNGMISAVSFLSNSNALVRADMAFNLSGPVTTSDTETSCAVFAESYRRRASVIVIPSLVKLLNDPDQRVVQCAAFALGRLRIELPVVLPALTNLIGEARASESSRAAVAKALGNFGSEARAAAPLLKRLVDEDQGKLGSAAAAALKQITGESASKAKLESN